MSTNDSHSPQPSTYPAAKKAASVRAVSPGASPGRSGLRRRGGRGVRRATPSTRPADHPHLRTTHRVARPCPTARASGSGCGGVRRDRVHRARDPASPQHGIPRRSRVHGWGHAAARRRPRAPRARTHPTRAPSRPAHHPRPPPRQARASAPATAPAARAVTRASTPAPSAHRRGRSVTWWPLGPWRSCWPAMRRRRCRSTRCGPATAWRPRRPGNSSTFWKRR